MKPKAWRLGRERNSLLGAAAVRSGAGEGWAQLRRSFLLFPGRERSRKSSGSRSCCKTGLWDGGMFGRRGLWTPLRLSLAALSLLVLLDSRLKAQPGRAAATTAVLPQAAFPSPLPGDVGTLSSPSKIAPHLPFPSRSQFHGFLPLFVDDTKVIRVVVEVSEAGELQAAPRGPGAGSAAGIGSIVFPLDS